MILRIDGWNASAKETKTYIRTHAHLNVSWISTSTPQLTYALAHCMLSCLAFTAAAAGTHQLLLSWVVYLGVHVQGS